MSIIKKITRIFYRKPLVPGSEVVNTVESENEATQKISPGAAGHTFFFSSYQHGFTNGVLQIKPDEDSFFRFLKHEREIERLEELRNTKTAELDKLKAELAAQKSIELEKKKELAVNRVQQEHLSSRLEELKERKDRIIRKRDLLSELRDKIKPEYAWLPALFFFIAGIVFIGADITVTKDITATGFDMGGIEGWIFAIGLAFTAFLIKPFIDRVLEKPFQQSDHILKKIYLFFLCVIVAAGIVMLFLLGSFRSDAKIAGDRISRAESQIESLNEQFPVDDKQVLAHTKETEVLLEDLAKNRSGELGLILSGILFAIGGGMCLSIAFPSLTALMNRYYFLPFRISRLRYFAIRLQKQEEEKSDALAQKKEVAMVASTEIETLEINKLQLGAEECQAHFDEITDQLYGEKALRDQMLYLDGKERGAKYNLEGELKYALKSSASELEDFANDSGDKNVEGKRKYTRRPYVKLRKLLADTYNKTKKGTFYDDSEIDIIA